ncbi:MAG TPA: helix-turn-helix domain-containing protein [Candidatus Limnocylindria bacterium]|nr:helix-turn-helix domain-containing protein [Candidatus Limnocylindria bacterium]
MTAVIDAWRAVDPGARLVSGDVGLLSRPLRGVVRTRAAAPHLPPAVDGQLLVVDAAILPDAHLDSLIEALSEAALEPPAVWVVGDATLEASGAELPVLAGEGPAAAIVERAGAYLEREPHHLAGLVAELRLAGAEAALADPQPAAPAGVVADRLRRGVAVTVDGALASINPRSAGRAIATRFAATHARLLADRTSAATGPRRTRDGLWIMERAVGPAASAWMFDDLPFARADEAALDALAITLRALLRRRPIEPPQARREPKLPPSTGDPLRDTLLAVARANGRIAPAARSLGVHRNTVLYRLRRGAVELGLDPRRPEDALLLLRDVTGDQG